MDDYRIKRYRRYDAEVNERDQKADNGLVLPSANLLFQVGATTVRFIPTVIKCRHTNSGQRKIHPNVSM